MAYSDLEKKLISLLLHLTAFIALSDDETLDPDVSATWLEDVVGELHELSPEDRQKIAVLAQEIAGQTSDVELQKYFENFPLDYRL